MSSSSLEESNTKKPQVIVGNYIIQDKIGQGSFATVYKAQHKVIHILCKELPFLINLFFFFCSLGNRTNCRCQISQKV